jgi:hypothetical protein
MPRWFEMRYFILLLFFASGADSQSLETSSQKTLVSETHFALSNGTDFTGTIKLVLVRSGKAMDDPAFIEVTSGAFSRQIPPTDPDSYYVATFISQGKVVDFQKWEVPAVSYGVRVADIQRGRPEREAFNPEIERGAAGSTVPESSVIGLVSDLAARSMKGPSFAPGRSAVIDNAGLLARATGNPTDCLEVNGSSTPCGGPLSLSGDMSGVTNSNGTTTVKVTGIEGNPVSATPPGNGQALLSSSVGHTWIPSSLTAPSTTMGGDIGNLAASSTVKGIQNRPVSVTAPTNGQALIYSTTTNSWVPASITATMGGDVSGSNSSSTVKGIQNRPVSSHTPADKAGLIYSSSANSWAAGSLAATMGGDVSGSSSSAQVTGIQNRPVAATAPAHGQALVYSTTSNSWVPGAPTAIMGGDVSGSSPASAVTALQNRPVAATAPANGQALVYSTSTNSWVPATPTAAMAGDVGGISSSTTVTGLQNYPVAATAPADGQALIYSGAANTWRPAYISPALSGDGTGSLSTAVITGIQSRPVSSTAPAPDQVLTWNSSTKQWTPGYPTIDEGFGIIQTSTSAATFGSECTSTAPCAVRFGSLVEQYAAPIHITLAPTAGTGQVLIFADGSGSIQILHNLSAVQCDGLCVATSAASPDFPLDTIPFWSCSVASGVWSGPCANRRAPLSSVVLLPGDGMFAFNNGPNMLLGLISAPVPIVVAVSPGSATLYANGTQQFTATVSNSFNSNVTWSVSSGGGTVSQSGLYTAPASVSTQQTATVKATSAADNSTNSTATITLMPPVAVSVTPASPSLYASGTQQFSATVINTSNTGVSWSVTSGPGTISTSGLYTAPAGVATQQSVTITATSAANSSAKGTATITLLPPVSVSVAPGTATIYSGQTQQFSATVSNASNTSVTWSIFPSVGTISSTGLYTGPGSVNLQQNITITAKSVANGAATGSATVTLMPAITISVTPTSPSLYANNTQQFTATVSNATNTNVTWSLTGNGAVSASGVYTAPAVISTQTTATVTATSVANTSVKQSVTITLRPPIAVSVTPAAVTLYANGTQQFGATVTNATDTTVTWSLTGAGTLSASGLYTAPSSIATQQSVTVTATSNANAAVSSSSTVTLMPPLTVSVTPGTGSLYPSGTQQFTATVTNATNTSVTWSANLGTISATGLYTAPATIATQQTATITATSAANTGVSGTASITLTPPLAYSFVRPITINKALCGTANSTNFPALISGTYSYLAATGNGGNVVSASGYDIAFFADAAMTTPLPFDLESYNPATGQIAAWVQIPTLSVAANTTIYMAYGNASIVVSQTNAASLWSSAGYAAVYHFSSGSLGTDASGNNYALTPHNSPTSTTGMIGSAMGLASASNQYADNSAGSSLTMQPGSDITISFWMKNDGSGDSAFAFQNSPSGRVQAHAPLNGLTYWDFGGTGPGRIAATWPSSYNNNWVYAVYVGKGNNTFQGLYLQGALAASANTGGSPTQAYNWLSVGAWPATNLYVNGAMDEFRVSTTVKPASWITAEYNNQSSPSTFYTIGAVQ